MLSGADGLPRNLPDFFPKNYINKKSAGGHGGSRRFSARSQISNPSLTDHTVDLILRIFINFGEFGRGLSLATFRD